MTSDELLTPTAPRAGQRHRRRRDRPRVRLDDVRPGYEGDGARGAAKILPGCDEDVTKVVLRLFKKRGSTKTGVAVTGHERATTPRPCRSARASRSRSTLSSSPGRAPPAVRQPRPRRYRRRSTSGLRGRRRGAPHRRARGGPSATSWPRRRWPIGLLPRASSRSTASSARTRSASTTRACPGIYCHPEVASPATREAAAGEAGRRGDVHTASAGNGRATIVGGDRRPGEGDRREAPLTAPAGASSGSTWSARGSPSSWARATWR